jgi:hypothetical protein
MMLGSRHTVTPVKRMKRSCHTTVNLFGENLFRRRLRMGESGRHAAMRLCG